VRELKTIYEHENTGNGSDTPFVYFVSGTPAYPPNSLYEAARETLGADGDFREALRKRIENGLVDGTWTITPKAWWFHFLLQYVDYFRNNFSDPYDMEASAVEVLRLIMQSSPDKAWNRVLEFVIKNIDSLSGWNKSWIKQSAERLNVTKGDNGNYYTQESNGSLVQIIGAVTTPETHLDFITDQIIRPYGCLRHLLNVFAIFAIGHEFATHPSSFPRSLKAVLQEPKMQSSTFQWQLMQYDRTRTIRWRPFSNLCDPEWLAGDMLARITDTLDRNVWQERIEKYGSAPSGLDDDCKWQTDYVLDSVISIGRDQEIYFTFSNKTFRWINGTAESKALLSVGVKDIDNHKTEDETLNRLLSVLVWEHRQPIVKRDGIGGPKRPLPLTWASRSSFGVQIDPQHLFGTVATFSEERWLALALYKEGVNSGSVFYRFLNFWKTIEVALKDKKDRWKWINTTAPQLGIHKERINQVTLTNPNIAEYLDYSCRSAIAHVFRRPIVNPDGYEDYVRISRDVKIVEQLGRMAVEQFLK